MTFVCFWAETFSAQSVRILFTGKHVMIRLVKLSCILGVILGLLTSVSLAQDLTPADYAQFWEPMVGNWKMTDEVDGHKTTGIFNFHFAPNNKCILLYHGIEEESFTQQLQGFNPVTKKQVAYGFADDGHFQIQTITVKGMRKGMKAAKGVGGDWERKVFSTDGTTTIFTSKWIFEEVEKDKVVMLWFDGKENGKPVHDEMRMILERVE